MLQHVETVGETRFTVMDTSLLHGKTFLSLFTITSLGTSAQALGILRDLSQGIALKLICREV